MLLSRSNKRANVLAKTGMWPQATFGYEAVGYSPTMLKNINSQMALAVSNSTKGKCPITSIALALGDANLPEMKSRIQLFRMWQWVVRNEKDKIQLAKAWVDCRCLLEANPNPWSIVKAPMGAVIQTPIGIGWYPVGPRIWKSPELTTWTWPDIGQFSIQGLLHDIEN